MELVGKSYKILRIHLTIVLWKNTIKYIHLIQLTSCLKTISNKFGSVFEVIFLHPFMKIYSLFFCLSILSSFLNAQTLVHGKILSSNNEPIPYVSVQIINSNIGSVANINGDFAIHMKVKSNDTLVVSHLGYKKKFVAINSENIKSPIIIHLQERVVTLQEIAISPLRLLSNANHIVKESIGLINSTSNKNSFIMKGYYKHIDIQDGEYKRMIEAAVLINDAGYTSSQQPIFEIEALRRSVDHRLFPDEDGRTQRINVVDSEYNQFPCWYRNNFRRVPSSDLNKWKYNACGRFDYGLLNKDFLKEHKFKLDTITTYEDDLVYVIKILPNSSSKPYNVMPRKMIVPIGKLYIRAYDFAILKMEYNYILNPHKSRTQDFRIVSRVHGSNIMFQITAIYKEYQDQIYLSYLKTRHFLSSSVEEREIRAKNTNKVYNLLERELVINKIIANPDSVSSMTARHNWKADIFDQRNTKDNEFWKDYNMMKETSQQEGLRKDLEYKDSLDEHIKQGQ